MLLPPSKPNVPEPERPQVAPLWLILMLAGLVGGALWALYPRQDLEERLLKSDSNPDLTESYLRNLIRGEPNDADLRDMLQRLEKAKALRQQNAVPQIINSKVMPSNNLWSEWENKYQTFQKTPASDAANKEKFRLDAIDAIKRIDLKDLDNAQLLYIAQSSELLGEKKQSKIIFDFLIDQTNNPSEVLQTIEIAAKTSLANGAYRDAAEWYLKASQNSADLVTTKVFLLEAIAVLQAGNLNNEALLLAESQLKPYFNDPTTIKKIIEISRAAGKPDVAQKYAKKLLKLSKFENIDKIELTKLSNSFGFYWDHENPPSLLSKNNIQLVSFPKLAFDDKTYELGYMVFLENRNQEDAWKVAKSAVQQAPGNLIWRKRLAEVSEWTGRNKDSLDQWLYIANQTAHHDAWMHVLRLAPGQLNDHALSQALEYQVRNSPSDKKNLNELIRVYERLGEPEKAIRLLNTRANYNEENAITLASLYENMGKDELAFDTWKGIFIKNNKVSINNVLKASVLALKIGKGQQALEWLRTAQIDPAENDQQITELLRTKAEVAELQNSETDAYVAYKALIDKKDATSEDFDAFIEILNHRNQLESAASSAEIAWEKFQNPKYLLTAMSLYVSTENWKKFGSLLESAHHNSLVNKSISLQQDPSFYILISTYYQATQNIELARKAYRAGIQSFPTSKELQQAALWFAIDTNDTSTINYFLQRYEESWAGNEDYHDALAAAYQALSLPQVALDRYLRPRLPAHRDDFLWLMAYADSLDQNQQTEEAWQLRRHLLSKESNASRENTKLQKFLSGSEGDSIRRLARARLLMSQYRGDTEYSVLQELLRLDTQSSSSNNKLSDAAIDILMGWHLDQAQHGAVRNMLWEKYSRSRSAQPKLWAEISTSLAEDDTENTKKLLAQYGAGISRYDRVTAASRLQDVRLAQTAAFESMTHQSFDDSLQDELTESLLSFSDHVGMIFKSRSLNELSEDLMGTNLNWSLSPRWNINIDAYEIKRKSQDTNLLVNPNNEKVVNFSAQWKNKENKFSMGLGLRKSLKTYHPLSLEWNQNLGHGIRWKAVFARQSPTEETIALRLGGMKNRVGVGLFYNLTPRDMISIEHFRDNFNLQTGLGIGKGNTTNLLYTHSFRSAAPSIDASIFWSAYKFSENNRLNFQGKDTTVLRYLPNSPSNAPANYLLPLDFNYFGISLSTNQIFQQDYTRKWQPFANISLTRHSREGTGYGTTIGVAGSVLGQDHLSLGFNFSKSSPQARGSTRELFLSYRKHF